MSVEVQSVGNLQNDQKQARSLYSKTTKLEKQLTSELRKTHDPVDERITQLRNKVKDNFEQVIFLDFNFAASKDIDQLLWKSVFYKPIEQFRKLIKKTSAQKNTDSAKQGKHVNIVPAFRSFLNEATEYYKSLFERLQQFQVPNNESKKLASLHKCQIILGDLARYRELYNESGKRDFSTAKEHYFKALDLVPSNGNPHNQLAVLATYDDDECEAIYRYFRSLSVHKPFISARENLILLFEKNRQRASVCQKNPDKAQKLGLLKRFKLYFVRLHGIIFTKTGMEHFRDTLNTAVDHLKQLLDGEALPKEFSLKLSVMNIFSIVNAKCPPDGSTSSEPDEEKRQLLLAAASSLAYTTTSYIMEHVVQGQSQLLRTVAPLVQWLCHNYHDFDLGNLGNDEELKNMLSSLVQLLNKFKIPRGTIESLNSDSLSLPEDSELKGFLPLDFAMPNTIERSSTSNDQIDYFVRLCRIRNAVRSFYETDTPLIYYHESQDMFSLESSIDSPPPTSQDNDTAIENEEDMDHIDAKHSPQETHTILAKSPSQTNDIPMSHNKTTTEHGINSKATDQHPASDFLSKEFFGHQMEHDVEENSDEEEEIIVNQQPPETHIKRDMNSRTPHHDRSDRHRPSSHIVKDSKSSQGNTESIVQPFADSKIDDQRVSATDKRPDTNTGVIGQLKLNQTSYSPFGNSLFGTRSQMLFGSGDHAGEDAEKKSSSLFSSGSMFSWENQQNAFAPSGQAQHDQRSAGWNTYQHPHPHQQYQHQYQYQQSFPLQQQQQQQQKEQQQQKQYQNSLNWGYQPNQFHPNFVQEQSHMFYNHPNKNFVYQQQQPQNQYQQQQQQQHQYMYRNGNYGAPYSSPSHPMASPQINHHFTQPLPHQQYPSNKSAIQQQQQQVSSHQRPSEYQADQHPQTRNPFV